MNTNREKEMSFALCLDKLMQIASWTHILDDVKRKEFEKNFFPDNFHCQPPLLLRKN